MTKLATLVLGLATLHAGCSSIEEEAPRPVGGELFPAEPQASGVTFQVVFSAAPQLPACAAAGFFATGAVTVVLSEDESEIDVGGLRYRALSSDVTGAHIHWGPPADTGPIVFDMGTAFSMTFTAGNYPRSLPDGVPADFRAFVAEMLTGNTYIDLHTDSCMDGELRGQLR